jgi:hypothetical protein
MINYLYFQQMLRARNASSVVQDRKVRVDCLVQFMFPKKKDMNWTEKWWHELHRCYGLD